METILLNHKDKLYVPILSRLGFTQKMGGGVQIGTAPVEVVDAEEGSAESTQSMADPI